MGTFFHGGNSSAIETPGGASAAGDGFHTLYLLNQSSSTTNNTTPYVHFSDTQPLHLNSPNALNLSTFSHAPPPPSHSDLSPFHPFASPPPPRVHYNLWGSIIDSHPHPTSAVPTASTSSGGPPSASASAVDVSPHMGFRRPAHQQGLSLTLSSQHTVAFNNRSLSGEFEHAQASSSAVPTSTCDDVRIVVPSGNHGSSSVQSFVLGSKYLRAAQEVLEEVVNVGNTGFNQEDRPMKEKMTANNNKDSTSAGGNCDVSSGDHGGGENSGNGKQGGDLSTAQRQELQMKKSKLLTILDEVEQRYRQYHHQMQIVIASFEQAAGYGAAKTYTSLALKTISKQFRCLKDAIASQIRATSKTLGEDDCLGAKVQGSRLRFVDHQLRQQRALQQLGMMQHNAWRPQRGLPERAVSILRAWLFEHFLHPYPKDSDKVMLAKQTGLTRSQVSNWFINARVRLWKPMVEEMYTEEMKEQEGNNSKEVGSANTKDKSQPQDPSGLRLDHHHHHQMKGLQSNNPDHQSFNNQTNNTPTDISNYLSGFPIGSSSHHHNHEMQIRNSPKKPRSNSEVMNNSPSSILSVDMEMKAGGDHIERSEGNAKLFGMETHSLISGNNGNDNNNGGGGFGGFTIEDMGRYNVADHQLAPRFHGNGVSLTLGLPHTTDNNLPGHGFLSHNMNLTSEGSDFCAMNAAPPSHSNASYENIDHIQNRKRFAAQLLPDFVA